MLAKTLGNHLSVSPAVLLAAAPGPLAEQNLQLNTTITKTATVLSEKQQPRGIYGLCTSPAIGPAGAAQAAGSLKGLLTSNSPDGV